MRRALLACSVLLFSCADKAASGPGTRDTGEQIVIDPDPGDTAGEQGPVDADGDGHPAESDCDDGDADVHPGAPETWNGIDDDCDGRRDADGTYRGEAHARATAVYEGDTYRFDLVCTSVLERDGADFILLVTCPTDAEDDMAQRLLGASLILQIEEDQDDREAPFEDWTGRGVMRSSDGWDTWLDASLAWVAMDGVDFSASRSAASLAITADGTMRWTGMED
ncbi:MAG: putative metal-binding motif-containing protein [Myxococcota bacterium]|nr:putative metal-binding motif-containing protein [Myxococcota bacterium]MEC8422801.1 putative metal-binding motif-containing protein [Myxococcota bacterium]